MRKGRRDRGSLIRLTSVASVLAVALLVFATVQASDEEAVKTQQLVDNAQITFEHFVADPNMGWFRDHLDNAQGLLIVPQLIKGGFIFGGSGGSGVLLARDEKTNKWSYPAFYTMGSVTFGLQIGGEVSEIILMVMTQKGMDKMLTSSFKLGADVEVAAGPVGAGGKVATADILAFARSKGLYGGLNVEGAVIATREKLNNKYYGKSVRPLDILVRRDVRNKKADPLIKVVTKATKK